MFVKRFSCECVVFWVLVMRCLYVAKVPVSMRQPETDYSMGIFDKPLSRIMNRDDLKMCPLFLSMID